MKHYRPILTTALVLALSVQMALPARAMPYALNIQSNISSSAKIVVRVYGKVACNLKIAAHDSANCASTMDSTAAPVSVEAIIVESGREHDAWLRLPARSLKFATITQRDGHYEIELRHSL